MDSAIEYVWLTALLCKPTCIVTKRSIIVSDGAHDTRCHGRHRWAHTAHCHEVRRTANKHYRLFIVLVINMRRSNESNALLLSPHIDVHVARRLRQTLTTARDIANLPIPRAFGDPVGGNIYSSLFHQKR